MSGSLALGGERTGERVTLTPQMTREALADAYRDAALADADMTGMVVILEEVRPALIAGPGLLGAWNATNAAVGRSRPGAPRTILVALRDRVHAHLLDACLDDLRRLPPDGNERAKAWLVLVADALTQLRPDVVAAFSSVKLPAAAANVAGLVRQYQADLNRSEWGHAYPLYEAVARHDLVPAPLRAVMAARCAELRLLRLDDPPGCRQWLEYASGFERESALLEHAWGTYWLFRGDLETSRKHLLHAVDLDEASSAAYSRLAESYEREEDLYAASTWYEAGRANCPGDADPYLRLLHFYARKDQIDQHRDELTDLLELAETLAPYAVGDVYIHGATTYHDLGDTAESDRWIERAIEVDRGRTDTYIWKASVLADRQLCDQAFEVMRTAEQAAPGDYDVCLALAQVNQTCGHKDEAPAWIERALERRPAAGIRTWLLLADAYRQASDLTRAEEKLIRAIQLQNDSIEATDTVASLAADYAREQDRTAAEMMLSRILDAVGPAWEAWYHSGLGDLSFGGQDYAQALTCYQEAAGIQPDVGFFDHKISYALRELNRFDEARLALDEAVTFDRDFLWSRSDAGLIANAEANSLYSRQDYAAAIPLYQEAAKLRPGDAVIFTNLADAWDRLDDPQRRREALEGSQAGLRTAAELDPGRVAVAVRLAGVQTMLAAEREFGQLAIDPPPIAYAARLVLPQDLLHEATVPSGELSPELLTTIAALRTRLREGLNVTLPGVTVTDDLNLAAGVAQFELDGVCVDETMSPVDHRFCVAEAESLDQAGVLAGERSPARLADGQTGWWIAEAAWGRAEAAGLELRSRLMPVLASLAAAADANVHHMINVDGVAGMLGNDRVAEAPGELVDFTQALRLHLSGGLPIDDVGALWSRYRAERAAGATLTAAAEALRQLPRPQERIKAWCHQRPAAWVGEEHEAWLAERSVMLSGGPVLDIDTSDIQRLSELMTRPIQAVAEGCVLVAHNASLRPVLASLLREYQVIAALITESEVPPGIVPVVLEVLNPGTSSAGTGPQEGARA